MTKYTAFLRGINIRGYRLIKMTDLARLFESLGFSNVKTLQASGNVILESPDTSAATVAKTIEGALHEALGYDVKVILRTIGELQTLINLDPFKKVPLAKDVRLHVTFLADKAQSALPLPYRSSHGFEVIHKTAREIFSVVLPAGRTVDLMTFVEKEFGKASTTRTWNTVQRIAAS